MDPGTRNHLFVKVEFLSLQKLQAWKIAFPNPSTSAACYAKSLSIGYHRNGAPADAEEGDWIPTFSRIEHLEVHIFSPKTPLAPFHGFSPAIKSLHIKIDFTYSTCQIFNLICSFPFLQDLSLKLFSLTYHDACFDEQSAIPALQFTRAHGVSRAFCLCEDKTYRLFVAIAPQRSPLQGTQVDITLQRRRFANRRIDGGVFLYP